MSSDFSFSSVLTSSFSSFPSNPLAYKLLGRSNLFTELQESLTWATGSSSPTTPVALVGADGLGKATLAQQLLVTVTPQAKEVRRVFVRCEECLSENQLLWLLFHQLDKEELITPDHPYTMLRSALASAPTLVVLVNVDLVIQLDKEKVLYLLERLFASECTTTLLTMRDISLVDSFKTLEAINLQPLPDDSIKEVFLGGGTIHFAHDANLPSILQKLNGHPLATQLLSGEARLSGSLTTIRARMDDFKRAGQANPLEMALDLSCRDHSKPFTPIEYALLRLLVLLPFGVSFERFTTSPSYFDLLEGPLSTLLAASIVNVDTSGLAHVPLPVKEYLVRLSDFECSQPVEISLLWLAAFFFFGRIDLGPKPLAPWMV